MYVAYVHAWLLPCRSTRSMNFKITQLAITDRLRRETSNNVVIMASWRYTTLCCPLLDDVVSFDVSRTVCTRISGTAFVNDRITFWIQICGIKRFWIRRTTEKKWVIMHLSSFPETTLCSKLLQTYQAGMLEVCGLRMLPRRLENWAKTHTAHLSD